MRPWRTRLPPPPSPFVTGQEGGVRCRPPRGRAARVDDRGRSVSSRRAPGQGGGDGGSVRGADLAVVAIVHDEERRRVSGGRAGARAEDRPIAPGSASRWAAHLRHHGGAQAELASEARDPGERVGGRADEGEALHAQALARPRTSPPPRPGNAAITPRAGPRCRRDVGERAPDLHSRAAPAGGFAMAGPSIAITRRATRDERGHEGAELLRTSAPPVHQVHDRPAPHDQAATRPYRVWTSSRSAPAGRAARDGRGRGGVKKSASAQRAASVVEIQASTARAAGSAKGGANVRAFRGGPQGEAWVSLASCRSPRPRRRTRARRTTADGLDLRGPGGRGRVSRASTEARARASAAGSRSNRRAW